MRRFLKEGPLDKGVGSCGSVCAAGRKSGCHGCTGLQGGEGIQAGCSAGSAPLFVIRRNTPYLFHLSMRTFLDQPDMYGVA